MINPEIKPKSKRGGVRPGAGRKKDPNRSPDRVATGDKDPDATVTMGVMPEDMSPLQVLESTMRNPEVPDALRLRAAIAAAQYRHTKRKDGGKKEEQEENAQKIARNKFAPGSAPVPLRKVAG